MGQLVVPADRRARIRRRPRAPSCVPPALPAARRGLGRLLGGHFVLAAVAISHLGAAAFVLLYRLALRAPGCRVRCRPSSTRDLPGRALPHAPSTPRRCSSRSRSARSSRPSAAVPRRRGLVAGLAMLTRLVGIALLPALALLAWRARERRRASGVALAPVAICRVAAAVGASTGEPFSFLTAAGAWGREFHRSARSRA